MNKTLPKLKIGELVNISVLWLAVGIAINVLTATQPASYFYLLFTALLFFVPSLLLASIAAIKYSTEKEKESLKLNWRIKFVISVTVSIILIGFTILLSISSAPANNLQQKIREVRMTIENSRIAAESYYDSNNQSYSNVCNSSEFEKLAATVRSKGSEMRCFSTTAKYCVAAKDLSQGEICVDSTGYSSRKDEGFKCSVDYIACE